jgi:hypothetical protein
VQATVLLWPGIGFVECQVVTLASDAKCEDAAAVSDKGSIAVLVGWGGTELLASGKN